MMTMKVTLFAFIFLVVMFVHGVDGHALPTEGCDGFHVDPSSTELHLPPQTITILRTKCLEGFTKVKTLVLKNCNIEKIEPDAFRTMESLVEVDLSDNLLDNLPDNLFEQNTQLEKVSLRNNKFIAVPHVAVPLTLLDLSRNKISSINPISILDVQKLDLAYNRLETLSSQDMAILKNVIVIDINNNPWKCGAEFDEVLCWSLKRTDASSEKIPLKCFNPGMSYDVSYTILRRQALCDMQVESTEMPSSQTHMPVSEVPSTVEIEQGDAEVGDLAYVSQTSSPEAKKKAFYKPRNSAVKKLVSEEENSEAVVVKNWEVIAFIGWMCAAVTIAILAYIIYAFKLNLKPSYKRIIDDHHSQGP